MRAKARRSVHARRRSTDRSRRRLGPHAARAAAAVRLAPRLGPARTGPAARRSPPRRRGDPARGRRSRRGSRRSSCVPSSRPSCASGGTRSSRSRSACSPRRTTSLAKLTELTRRDQGIADREQHLKQLQDELKALKEVQRQELERISSMTTGEAKARILHELGGAGAARAGRPGPPDGGGGRDRGEAPGAESRRRRAAAGGGKCGGRDHRDAGRASVRRHEGPHHRAGRPEHPHARAPHRGRLHHRRHAERGRALVVRRDPPRDRADDAAEADRGRPHPPDAHRGDVLPLEGGARRARPAGGGAGGVRGELRRAARGAREDPRPASLPHELRPERAQAHARSRLSWRGSWPPRSRRR